MTIQLHDRLSRLRLGDPVQHDRITVVPLYTEPSSLDYLTLEEATEKGLVKVEEVSESGSVPQMRVRNTAPVPVFIPDGTALVGSKQNRVVNLSLMLAAESVTIVPVSCVEQGRWHRVSHQSAPAEYSDKELGRKMCRGTSRSLKGSG